jgi:CheY-like chemotaxis protein
MTGHFVQDDEEGDVEMAMEALQRVKISNRIHVAHDGAEALDFLFRTGAHAGRSHGTGPHMILLDLNLPKVSGLEVLRRIKADSRTRSIPVVVLTASESDRNLAAGKRLGADGYIVKPVDFHTLARVTPKLSLRWALLKPSPTSST